MRHSAQHEPDESASSQQTQRALPLHQRLQAIKLERGNISQSEAMKLLWEQVSSSAIADVDPWNRAVELQDEVACERATLDAPPSTNDIDSKHVVFLVFGVISFFSSQEIS